MQCFTPTPYVGGRDYAHMNVTTITRFVQNYTVGVCLHYVASTMHVAILWPYSQALLFYSFAELYTENLAFQCVTLQS